MSPLPVSAGGVFRAMLAVATVVFGALGLLVGDDPRFYVASGACGTMWLASDLFWKYVGAPVGSWLSSTVHRSTGSVGPSRGPAESTGGRANPEQEG